MPSTPTSKSQVQAYRFVIRRMQSALVRKDAVMLHDPMRTHTRATVVGAILGVVVLAGFLLVSILSPANPKPGKGILISAQSGRVYVYAGKDGKAKLIPTTNLASARLLYAAIQHKGGGGQGGGPVQAQTVDDSSLKQLDGVEMGRLTGIPDGPDIIPTGDKQRAGGMWAICDNIDRQANLNQLTAKGEMTTTALTGVHELGKPLPQGQALLVRAPDKQEYLIYRTPRRINIDSNTSLADADAVRAKVSGSNSALAQAFGMSGVHPRPISAGLLNAIPQVSDLEIPDIPKAGTPDSFGLDVPVGHAFRVTNSDGTHDYYLVLPDGIEEVSDSVAQLVLAKHETSTGGLPTRQLAQVAGVPKKQTYDSAFSQFPDQVPQILTSVTAPTVCLGWSADTSDPKIPKEHTEITIGKGLPLPSKKDHPVPISTPNAGGEKIDSFWMPPGTAAVVRSASSAAQFGTGPISVVTGRGVRYGVPDLKTAKVVGLSHPRPAPASIVHLLPAGTELDMAHAQRTYDSLTVPPKAGSYSAAAERAAEANRNATGAQSGGK